MPTKQASDILNTLQKTYSLNNLDRLQKWGPIVQFQYDASGQTPIQRFVTLLVRMETGAWILCRQICSLQNGNEWPARPLFREITEFDAECWLREQKLAPRGA